MRNVFLVVIGALLMVSSIGCTDVQYKRFIAYSSTLDGDRGKDHPEAWENDDRTTVLRRGGGGRFRANVEFGPDGRYRSDQIGRNSSVTRNK